MGISDAEKNMLDSDNDYISSFENNLKFNNGMYETKLFWEDKPNDLENNWAIAKRRFGNLSIKMQDNNWLYNEYCNEWQKDDTRAPSCRMDTYRVSLPPRWRADVPMSARANPLEFVL
ncbi:uncharacterized protein TNCV_4880381 [Trichonephila clavipes]|nr:uncharacterized protein TNCV_4880381 [Trichonephila clavipes]